jgi:phosphatidylserine decarboxylase
MGIPLTKYGRREMAIATLVLGTLTAVGTVLFWPSAILPAALWVYVLAFFRDPPRRAESAGAFLSPADGNVADITPVSADGALGVEAIRIGVFMNVLSVHVNRSPCAGRVVKTAHHDGGFVDVRRPEAWETNESATIWLQGDVAGQAVPVAVRQVAGLIARRVVTDLALGQDLRQGQRIGMIKFGSRVELIVPAEWAERIAVRLGQKVRAGRTVLVSLPPEETPS